MPRRPARVTQADVARVVRAAKQAGACAVEVAPDGRILVKLVPDPERVEIDAPALEPKVKIAL